MKFTRNVKAISKLLLILLLLLATIVGAILSYLWVMGYFITLESVIPKKTTVSIENVTFNLQNTSHFFVTLLNPSYSPTEANVTEIVASTGKDIHNITEVHPLLPYRLLKGEEETFECVWNWANYTGETVKIVVFIADGSGSAYEVETSPVELMITAVIFTPVDTTHFNVTLYNSADSPIDLNFTRITVTVENGTTLEITEIAPSLPRLLRPNSYNAFNCSWDWSNYRGKNATIAVYTSQGYMAYRLGRTSEPVMLTIPSVLFDPANTTYFNVTVMNSEYSLAQANITLITVTLQNGTSLEVTVEPPPSLPYSLPPDDTVTFKCSWNWTNHRGENVIITVETLKGYKTSYPYTIP
jgi:hypothetical protein